jgi:hypothetical protein
MQNFDKGKRKNKEKNHEVQCLVKWDDCQLKSEITDSEGISRVFLKMGIELLSTSLLESIKRNKNFIIIGCTHSLVFITKDIELQFDICTNSLTDFQWNTVNSILDEASLILISLETESSTFS